MNHSIIISEKLLHYIWQFQRFNYQNLISEIDNEPIQILQVGQANTNAGPDFLEAKVQIGEMVWAGNIEIHIKSSDWLSHKHDTNQEYDSVILHVVWENDADLYRKNGLKIPVLTLKDRVDSKLLVTYQSLIDNSETIPCQNQFMQINSIIKTHTLERVLVNRLERKAEIVLGMLESNQGDWEETTYQLLAKTMGFGLNSIPFERLSKLIPLKFLQKHNNHLQSIEALLFGVAGFLEQPIDQYSESLKKEYQFLKVKFNLNDQINHSEWKFMRSRPSNFPTVRIAQFAQLIQQTKSLFSYFLLFENAEILKNMFTTKPSDYWESRYNFGKKSHESSKGMGAASVENILINTVVPILVAYSITKSEPKFIEKSMDLLEKIKPEKNRITRFWDSLEFSPTNAFESQASIELFNEYCAKKACLSCNIGMSILK